MTKLINKQVLLSAAGTALALLALYFAIAHRPHPLSLDQRQKQFVEYVDTVQLPNKRPVFVSSGQVCARSNGGSQTDCTLSKTFIYKLDGNYRDNGKEIFSYLKTKGFGFPPSSKYENEVEQKLHNTALAGNLSNSEPIIVDLYNTQNHTRVRVNLGDYGRTMPYAKSQKLDQLSTQQLIAGLEFYDP